MHGNGVVHAQQDDTVREAARRLSLGNYRHIGVETNILPPAAHGQPVRHGSRDVRTLALATTSDGSLTFGSAS